MKITHIRHGSHIIEFKDKCFLVDPVFSEQGTMPALPKGRVNLKNPLVPLPFNLDFISSLDGVFITHMHFDHFDEKAKAILPKDIAIYCSPIDLIEIKKAHFTNVTAIEKSMVIHEDIHVERTGGRHGVGMAGKLMGHTSGYVLTDISKDENEPKTYIIGDSIWCKEVSEVVLHEKPEVIIAFAGSAKLPVGKPITMATSDIDKLATHSMNAKIIALHMDAWNHCFLTRDLLKSFIIGKSYKKRIIVPNDGDHIEIKDHSS